MASRRSGLSEEEIQGCLFADTSDVSDLDEAEYSRRSEVDFVMPEEYDDRYTDDEEIHSEESEEDSSIIVPGVPADQSHYRSRLHKIPYRGPSGDYHTLQSVGPAHSTPSSNMSVPPIAPEASPVEEPLPLLPTSRIPRVAQRLFDDELHDSQRRSPTSEAIPHVPSVPHYLFDDDLPVRSPMPEALPPIHGLAPSQFFGAHDQGPQRRSPTHEAMLHVVAPNLSGRSQDPPTGIWQPFLCDVPVQQHVPVQPLAHTTPESSRPTTPEVMRPTTPEVYRPGSSVDSSSDIADVHQHKLHTGRAPRRLPRGGQQNQWTIAAAVAAAAAAAAPYADATVPASFSGQSVPAPIPSQQPDQSAANVSDPDDPDYVAAPRVGRRGVGRRGVGRGRSASTTADQGAPGKYIHFIYGYIYFVIIFFVIINLPL